MKVTVVFVLPDIATEIDVVLPPGGRLGEAVARSGLAAIHPQFDFTALRVGIWGKLADPATTLVDGDRVEVYRPLVADPRHDRLRRARNRLRK